MFYIKFNGYKKDCSANGLFFNDKIYHCKVVDEGRFYQTADENGLIIKFKSILANPLYNFSVVDGSELLINDEDEEECLHFTGEKRSGKNIYRMNGKDVSKEYFMESLAEAELLKGRGVSVLIEFEFGF